MYHVVWEGEAQEGGRETQTGDQELSVISCSKYIVKLDGQTMRCLEELCETLDLTKISGQLRGPIWAFSEKKPQVPSSAKEATVCFKAIA